MEMRRQMMRLFPRLTIICAAFLLSACIARAEKVYVTLENLGNGVYQVEGHMMVREPADIAWKVLSDYNHIPDFVPSMRSSKIKSSGPGQMLLEQEAVGKVLFFSRRVHVLLKVSEKPMTQITFEDVDHRDFQYYTGAWQIDSRPDGLKITYALHCKRRFAAPDFIAKNVFKKSAIDLLDQVRKEIENRKAIARKEESHDKDTHAGL